MATSDGVVSTPVALTPDTTGNDATVALLPDGTATLTYAEAGTVTLVATATDAAGNAGTATATEIVVDPSVTQAPVASITSPTNNADVTAAELWRAVGDTFGDTRTVRASDRSPARRKARRK